MKSCVSDVNALLSNLIKAHDPLLPLTTHRHLAGKLHPAIAMLNQLEGVSVSHVHPKQGGERTNPPTGSSGHDEDKSNEPKDNIASGSKGEGKMLESDEDVPDEQELK